MYGILTTEFVLISLLIISNCCNNYMSGVFGTFLDFDFNSIISPNSFLDESFIIATSANLSHKVMSEWISSRQLSLYDIDNKTEIAKMWAEIKTSSLSNESLVVLLVPENEETATEIIKEIKKAEDDKLIRKPTYFMVWPKMLDGGESEITSLDSNGLLLDCNVYVLYKLRSVSNIWKTLEIYSIKSKKISQTVVFKTEKIEDEELLRKSIRRNDFQKTKIIAVQFGKNISIEYPESLKNERSSMDNETTFYVYNDEYGQFEVDIYHFLRDAFNFTEAAIDGTGFAAKEGDKEDLMGMASQINNDEADIAITSSEILAYRLARLTFLHPTYKTQIFAYFIQPPSSTIRDIFLHSFTIDLWLAMLSTWFLIAVGMVSLAWVKSLLHDLHENDKTIWEDCFLWATGTFCQQGWHVCPESTSMKILFISGLFTGLLSYIAYSAALVSMLSAIVVPIRSVADLAYFNYFIYRDNRTFHALNIIRELEDEHTIPRLPREERSILSEDVVEKIYNEKCSFFGIPDKFYPAIKARNSYKDLGKNICEKISKIPVSDRSVLGGMFIKKGSPLKESFNHRLIVIHERGMLFRLLENYYWKRTVQCLQKRGVEKESLGILDVFTAFIILIIGYCLSLSIFIVERCYPPNNSIVLGLGPNSGNSNYL